MRFTASLCSARSWCCDYATWRLQIPLLEQRVQQNQYDGEAWQMLVDELWASRQSPGMMEKLLETLKIIVAKYPSAVRCPKLDCRRFVFFSSLPSAR